MVDAAFIGWEKLWNTLGKTHYVESGSLDLCYTRRDLVDISRAALDQVIAMSAGVFTH
jgi:hypothetical protein